MKKSYTLHFGTTGKDLSLGLKSKLVEAYMHNAELTSWSRLTLVYRNKCSFTFEISSARAMDKKANYEGSCKGTKFKAEIAFT